jgi:hypothetical protein
MNRSLPEIQQIEKRIAELGSRARVEVLAYSQKAADRFPLYKISFGSTDPKAPVLGMVGGVHGLERIGAQVCVALLNSFSELVMWDEGTQNLLKNIRVFFIPVVNPIGILNRTRCNPRGVDLMRNAPVDGEGKIPGLLGGHRLSARLAWYRGALDSPMEIESQALVDAVEKEIRFSSLATTVDVHSGFGLTDRLWFPYAKRVEPFPDLALAYSLKELMDRTYPQHFYKFEPQAKNYTTHGDLWDYLYDRHLATAGSAYLPLCLEMGSWMWVKKNPWQIFSRDGAFNPLKGHRHRRTLRRHQTLFDFLLRATNSPQAWARLSPDQKIQNDWRARELWYV